MVELMIALHFGGHQSIYYAGIILTVCIYRRTGPLSEYKNAYLSSAIIYAIYLIPFLAVRYHHNT